MKYLVPLVLALFCLSAELFLREAFALDAWTPDLVTVLLLWLGAAYASAGGAVLAGVVGLLADGFVGSPVGLHMLHSVLLFHGAALIANQVRFQGILGRLLLGLAGGLLSLFLLVAISRLFLGDTRLAERIGVLLVPRVTPVLVLVPLVFPLLERIERLMLRRDSGDLI